MTVPFIEMAPGIKARLAWQIMGRRDGLLNPTGIRYVPPDELGKTALANVIPPRLPDISVALSGLQLLVSSGSLAVSAATLAEVRRVSAKVDAVLAEQRASSQKLDSIIKQLETLSWKVSEGRLATIVDHAVRSAAHGTDHLSFVPFMELTQDLEGFMQDAAIARGAPTSLRLGSDLRGTLRRICELLRGVRIHAARIYNQESAALESSWLYDDDKDYWSDADQAHVLAEDDAVCRQVRLFNQAASRAHATIDRCFRMNSVEDHTRLQSAMNEALVSALIDSGVDEKAAVKVISDVHNGLVGNDNDHKGSNPFLDLDFMDKYGDAILDVARETAARSHPEGYYPPTLIDAARKDKEHTAELLDGWRSWWLHQTDIGLVYRTYRECLGVRDGYGKVFEGVPHSLVAQSRALDSMNPSSDVRELPVVVVTLDDEEAFRALRSASASHVGSE